MKAFRDIFFIDKMVLKFYFLLQFSKYNVSQIFFAVSFNTI